MSYRGHNALGRIKFFLDLIIHRRDLESYSCLRKIKRIIFPFFFPLWSVGSACLVLRMFTPRTCEPSISVSHTSRPQTTQNVSKEFPMVKNKCVRYDDENVASPPKAPLTTPHPRVSRPFRTVGSPTPLGVLPLIRERQNRREKSRSPHGGGGRHSNFKACFCFPLRHL